MNTKRTAGYYEAGITNRRLDVDAAEQKLALAINEAIDSGQVSAERAAELLGISRATLYRRYRWVQQQLR